MKMPPSNIVLFVLAISHTYALIAYDCRGSAANYSIVSLLDIDECDPPESNFVEKNVEVRVIQQKTYSHTQVFECNMIVQRMINHCGWLSHSSIVKNGLLTYVHVIGRTGCLEIHETNAYKGFHGRLIDNIKANATTRFSIDIVGSLSTTGSCSGGNYVSNGVTYESVTVTASITLKTRDYRAMVRLETDKIHLRSGLTCKFTDQYCMDSDNGEAFWERVTKQHCGVGDYASLYKGKGALVSTTNSQEENSSKYMVVEQDNVVFAITVGKVVWSCGRKMYATEHPRLLLLFKYENADFDNEQSDYFPLTSHEIDLTAYINSKLLYVEQGYKRALDKFQAHTIYRRCLLQRQILKTRLALAPLSPNTVSTLLKGRKGSLGVVLGESLYIFECLPREVKIRRVKERRCYKELPVFADGEAMFVAPVTRILQIHGEEITCSNLIPPLFLVDNQWVGLSPEPTTGFVPELLKINREPKFNFKPIQRISEDGIYTREELERAKSVMLHNMERDAISSILTGRLEGQDLDLQGLDPLNIFSEKDLKALAKRTMEKIWGWFTFVGDIMSGILGLYVMGRVIKFFLEVTINAFAIHNSEGCSIKMLASLWDTLTIVILNQNLKRAKETKDERDAKAENENVDTGENKNPGQKQISIVTTQPIAESKEIIVQLYPPLTEMQATHLEPSRPEKFE